MSLSTRSKILYYVSLLFLVYSLLWATAPFPAINAPARLILDLADWPFDAFSNPLSRDLMWGSAIGSGLLAAISIFLIGSIVPALRKGDGGPIRTTIIAMVVWYTIDGVGSYFSGVGSNIFFNTIYLALVLFPLVGIPDHLLNNNPEKI